MKNKTTLQLLLIISVISFFNACTEKYQPATISEIKITEESECVKCHTDETLLKSVAAPLPPSEHSGEG